MIDWEYVKSMLGLSDDNKERYNLIIPVAISKVEKEVGRNLVARDYEEKLSGNGMSYIVLPHHPVNSLELRMDHKRVFGSETIVQDSLYDLDKGTGIITLYSGKFPINFSTVKVLYNAGFDPIPDDLKEAALEIVKWLYNRLDDFGGAIGHRDIGVDGITSTTEMVLPLHVMKTLGNYMT